MVRSCTGRSAAHSSGKFSDPARLGPQEKTPQLHHGSFDFFVTWKIVLFRGKNPGPTNSTTRIIRNLRGNTNATYIVCLISPCCWRYLEKF